MRDRTDESKGPEIMKDRTDENKGHEIKFKIMFGISTDLPLY